MVKKKVTKKRAAKKKETVKHAPSPRVHHQINAIFRDPDAGFFFLVQVDILGQGTFTLALPDRGSANDAMVTIGKATNVNVLSVRKQTL